MIITIKTVESQTGDFGEYLKVTGLNEKGEETTKNVSTKFQEKWALLQPNTIVEFKMAKNKEGKWQITDIISATAPPPTTAETHHTEVSPKEETVKPRTDENQLRQRSIEVQNAMTTTANIWIAGKIKDDDPLVTALISLLGNIMKG